MYSLRLNVNSVIIMDIIVMDGKVLLLLFLFSFRFFHSHSKVTGEQIIYVEMTTLQSLLFIVFQHDFPTSH
jgi:hypothetical protein